MIDALPDVPRATRFQRKVPRALKAQRRMIRAELARGRTDEAIRVVLGVPGHLWPRKHRDKPSTTRS